MACAKAGLQRRRPRDAKLSTVSSGEVILEKLWFQATEDLLWPDFCSSMSRSETELRTRVEGAMAQQAQQRLLLSCSVGEQLHCDRAADAALPTKTRTTTDREDGPYVTHTVAPMCTAWLFPSQSHLGHFQRMVVAESAPILDHRSEGP